METFWDNSGQALSRMNDKSSAKEKKEDWYDIYKESERRRRKMRGKEIKKVVKAVHVTKSPSSSSSSTLSTISLSKSSVDSRVGVGGKKNASFKMDDDNNIHDGEGGQGAAAADACMRASLPVLHFIEYFIC
jgi:hypothetical protein